MSGALLADSLAALHAQRAAPPAKKPALPALLVSHGRADPVLPFARGASIEALLTPYGYAVTFYPFEGGHEIPAALVDRLRQFLFSGLR
jgi:phospholipase/carboxylesterase